MRQEYNLTVALAGNPNVGKSTLFNALTGLNQHTGNWSGKTVEIAYGKRMDNGITYIFVDLPGTYSLLGTSEDERLAGEYVRENIADCLVVVCDGSCLERSLILALQVIEASKCAVVCVNLMDEANRNGITVDKEKLSKLLGVSVVLTSAGDRKGLALLLKEIQSSVMKKSECRHWDDPIVSAEEIANQCVTRKSNSRQEILRSVDRLLVSRRFGYGFLFLLLLGIVWLTVWGANYPSMLLESLFNRGYILLNDWMQAFPWWLRSMLVDGLYTISGRVISVMLPPMAIFFPLFTILEDVGYLPRMAFLLDPCMARCGGCGKQALTLCMGLGCNAVGVMGCRIIDSPRERLCAILTNAMVPCNGRFPTLILLGSLFFPSVSGALVVAACVALGVVGAMVISGLLGRTVCRGKPSVFLLEIPPFRRPRLGKILVRSLLERTLVIAARALTIAAPAGVMLWILSNTSLMGSFSAFLDPAGQLLGMNGIILLGFILSFPANELTIPIILMALTQTGSLQTVEGSGGQLLQTVMTWQMAVPVMVFTLFHWPCSTTLMTIYKETKSIKKTAVAFLLPTAVGCVVCMVLNLFL